MSFARNSHTRKTNRGRIISDEAVWLTEANIAELVSINTGIEALRNLLPREVTGGTRNLNKVLATWPPRSAMHNLGSVDPEQGIGGIKSWVNTPEGAQATDMRMLKNWDDRFPGSGAICDRFVELATEMSGGAIAFQQFGPETVPPLAQVDAGRNGVFQVLCTYSNFHSGDSTLLAGRKARFPTLKSFAAAAPGISWMKTIATSGRRRCPYPRDMA